MNQIYLSWKPAEGNDFRAGRQRIIYDNARFVGNVGWRQNDQTYDAVSYRFKNKGGIDLQFAYIGNANRIFGDDTRGGAMFRTPLATLHAFNGWADKFLATPAAGLNDAMIGVKGKVFGSWKWNVIYHDFDAESGSASYGKEIDAALSTKFSKHYGVLFKAAWFDGKENSGPPDTVKLWFQLVANF